VTIRVAVGDRFEIPLQSNPTTGFRWRLTDTPDEGVLKPLGTHYEATGHPPGGEPPGSEGTEVFAFEAVGSGEAALSFGYARPWKGDAPPARTRRFLVVVG
jgi:predicted secreted protein